jgi:hypothetical protein
MRALVLVDQPQVFVYEKSVRLVADPVAEPGDQKLRR